MTGANRRWGSSARRSPPGSRTRVAFPSLFERWLSLRLPIAVLAVGLGLLFGLLWDWPEALEAAALGTVLLIDVLSRRSGRYGSVIGVILIDTTLMGLALFLLQAPVAVVPMPFAYLTATTYLFLDTKRSHVVVAYQALWMAGLLAAAYAGWWRPAAEGPRAVATGLTMASLFIIAVVFMFGRVGATLSGARRAMDQKLRYEQAIANASRALVTGDEDTALDRALAALLEGTEASAVFVERNSVEPGLGLCSTLIAEALAEGHEHDPEEIWTLVPWTEMPFSFDKLSKGRPVSFTIDELPAVERARYEDSGVRSEMDIPITLNGEWVGLIGFNDIRTDRRWEEQDINLLLTAAELIAWHWERTAVQRALRDALAAKDERIRYQEALSRCSRLLLMRDDEPAIDEALAVIGEATGADRVYIDRNYEDPVLGLCLEIVHEADRPDVDFPGGLERWRGGSYAELPTALRSLSQGQVCVIQTHDLEGAERELYLADGTVSELNIPILVDGQWVGSIAFASYTQERHWPPADIAVLETMAEMIGAFWGRNAAQARLERAVQLLDRRFRLEQALARASQQLLSAAGGSIEKALEELLAATEADFVSVDENYTDPDLGLCTRITHWVHGDGHQSRGGDVAWWGGPYSEFPAAYHALSQGRPAIIYMSELSDAERAISEREGLKSELNLPIFVEGGWRGSVAFADYEVERRWTEEDIGLLKAAAEMIGAYWARLESQHRLEAAVESLNTRLRYEEALAECSKHLLGEGEEALASALSQLVAATDADYMWLEENYEDPELGLCARLVHEIQSPRLDEYALEDPWLGGPHSETPTSYRALSRGEPSVILTSELSGSERALYESDGLLSELVLPVFTFGRWTGAIGFADYTVERQWVERDIQILRTASEMVGSYLERRQSRERLEALVRSKDEFIASVSHELRTPLTSVLGFAGVLLDAYEDMPDGERRDLMALIRHEAQEVAWIVDDLLVFARADIGTLAATAVDLSLHEQVTAVLSGQPDAHAARVALEGDDVRATADPGRVRQIVRNLVTNALKYGGPGVTVEVDAVDESAVVRVTDDGNGIPENEWESIFEPYYRAHDPGGQPGSVGLGLAVSRKLAMLMGGDLTYTHADGRSIFQLLLPLARTGIAASA